MSVIRQDIVDVITSWKGLKEKDGTYKPIIDIYNSIIPLPRGYKLKYTDDWCAGTISAAYHQAGASRMFPCECSCPSMVTKARHMGCWVEKDNYFPSIADVCFYDSQDDGKGENISVPDSAGIVVSINKKAKSFVVLIGNSDSEVRSRTMSVNGKYIRGFISPVFDEDADRPLDEDNVAEHVPGSDENTKDNVTVIVGRGTLSKVAAGSEMHLQETPMYASALTESISAYKTGVYYIWSVDTINNRIRITNAKTNVGKKGQVTGWITVSSAISLMVAPPCCSASSTTPTYQVNAVYVVQLDGLTVRKGPGSGYEEVGYAGLTANAKKYDKYKTGCLYRGAKVTCLEVQVIGANVWIRIPSGWVAAYYDKKYYVK